MTAKHASGPPHVFARKQAANSQDRATASEILATDLAAFEAGGGVIEKLGTTRTLKHIADAPDPPPTPDGRRADK